MNPAASLAAALILPIAPSLAAAPPKPAAPAALPRDFAPPPRGPFPNPAPFQASYSLGWGSLTAGRATVHGFTRPDGTLALEASASTTGFARSLWRIDARLRSETEPGSLRPIAAAITEIYPHHTVETRIRFSAKNLVRSRQEIPRDPAPEKRKVKLPQPLDLYSALLLARSQPLENGSRFTFVVYPTNSAYLAEVTVLGRERIRTPAGRFDAIKTDLRLQKLDRKLGLSPHGKFRRATAWVSNDDRRTLLRIRADIFVGSVWAELLPAPPPPGSPQAANQSTAASAASDP